MDELLRHLNSQHPSIQFTQELEKDGSLPYLDLALQQQSGRDLMTTVFRKPAHTGRYLNFTSNHPRSAMRSVVNSLFSRLEYVTKGGMAREQETQQVTDELLVNGYPRKFIENTERLTPSEENTTIATASIPYVKGVGETITRVLKPLNIRTVCRPHPMKWFMMQGAKDTLPQSEQRGAVYALGCMECNKVYIGETGRTAKVRAKEHIKRVRGMGTQKNQQLRFMLSRKGIKSTGSHTLLKGTSIWDIIRKVTL